MQQLQLVFYGQANSRYLLSNHSSSCLKYSICSDHHYRHLCQRHFSCTHFLISCISLTFLHCVLSNCPSTSLLVHKYALYTIAIFVISPFLIIFLNMAWKQLFGRGRTKNCCDPSTTFSSKIQRL